MDLFSKNGAITKFVEAMPGGGLITAPIHAAAGNRDHAGLAFGQGGASLAACAIGGPLAGIAVSGGNSLYNHYRSNGNK